jgi:hypothetical protein
MTESERYRKATGVTLEQLAWAIDYLNRIGKPRIAESLRRNWVQIAKRARFLEDR